jgi:hypothetical protein
MPAKKKGKKKTYALGDYVLKKGGVTRHSSDVPADTLRAQIHVLNREPIMLGPAIRIAKRMGRIRDDTMAIAKKRAARKKKAKKALSKKRE